MSPDENEMRWRIEQLERRLDRADELARLESQDVRVMGRRLDEYAERFAAQERTRAADLEAQEKRDAEQWKALDGHRKVLMWFFGAAALGAVTAAIGVAVQAGGGLP